MKEQETKERLKKDGQDWILQDDTLAKTFTFPDFRGAMAFVHKVADIAERQKHHPRIIIEYDEVTLETTTHEESGITEKDFSLINAIEAL